VFWYGIEIVGGSYSIYFPADGVPILGFKCRRNGSGKRGACLQAFA
jgi:hypothetical protein